MLKIKEKVFLVRGAENGAIYDFNQMRFFRVPLTAIDFLENELEQFSKKMTEHDVDEFIQMCKDFDLLEDVENALPVDGDIENHLEAQPKPKFCWLEINSKCNQRCRHCFLGSELNSSELDYNLIRIVIKQLKSLGVKTVAITGGEPLLHRNFLQIVSDLDAAEMRVCLLTNGTLLNVQTMGYLKRHNVLIKIPLFGTQVQHDMITGLPGSYDRTVSAIRSLSEMGANIVVTSTVTSLNVSGVNVVREFCREIGVPFEPAPLYPIGQARENWMELSKNYRQILAACSAINGESGNGAKNREEELFQRIDSGLTPFCVCGSENIAISHDGTILPCLLLRSQEFHLGRAKDLCEVFMRKAGRFDEVQSLLNFNNDEKCRACEVKYVCKGGGCKAVSYLFEGEYGHRDAFYADCYYNETGGMGYPKVNCPM